MRPALAWAALAALALSAPAQSAAYERTVSATTGAPLFWPLPAVPYHVNTDRVASSPSCAASPAGDPALDAIRASYLAWRQPCASFDLVYAGTTAEMRTGLDGAGENIVVFRRGWCSNDPQATSDPCYTDPDVDCGNIYGCFEDHGAQDKQAVAITAVLYDPGSGRIFDADIQVNGWDGAQVGGQLKLPATNGWYFTCATPPDNPKICTTYGEADCYYMDLQNTITHEAGHVLGLAHTSDPNTVMFITTAPGEKKKRTLSQDDIGGVCAIYPEPSGCASAGGGAGGLMMLVAALAIRRRASPRTPRPGPCRRSPRRSSRSARARPWSRPSPAPRRASPSQG